jgi:hypothetical protein
MAFNNRISSFGSNDSGYDSGIIEVFDEPRPVLMKTQDQAKELARQKQFAMGGEICRRDAMEYQQDMLEHMLKMDVSKCNFSRSVRILLTDDSD